MATGRHDAPCGSARGPPQGALGRAFICLHAALLYGSPLMKKSGSQENDYLNGPWPVLRGFQERVREEACRTPHPADADDSPRQRRSRRAATGLRPPRQLEQLHLWEHLQCGWVRFFRAA